MFDLRNPRVLCIDCPRTYDLKDLTAMTADGQLFEGQVFEPPPSRLDRAADRLGIKDMPKDRIKTSLDAKALGVRYVCPAEARHHIPLDIARNETFVLALAGDKGSGKSTYVASLIDAINEQSLLEPFGVTVWPADQYTSDTYTSRYQVPMLEGTALDQTPAATSGQLVRPLIFTLGLDRLGGREVNLCIYDGAGEQMRNSMQQAEYNRYLYLADAVFFFIPPVALFRVVPRDTIIGDDQTLVTTQMMVKSVLEGLRLAHEVGREGHLGDSKKALHTSLVVTKADQLDVLPEFHRRLLEELDYRKPLDDTIVSLEDTSVEVESLLRGRGQGNFINKMQEQFPDIRCHLVAPAGVQYDPENLRFVRTPEPHRVVDPLVQMLYHRGWLNDPARP